VNNLGDVGAGHVLGRYELLMPIASGGMATVWAARLKGTRGFQKIVAIKTILPQLTEDPQFEQMFLDEASLASRIRHPHVAEILDLGEQAGILFLVMDWVDGEPLSVLLKTASKYGGIPLPITVRIISQACAGLHAAHELCDEVGNLLGLVHRDVSPQNILLTFDGVVKVVDFGVAKAAGRASPETNAGQIKGKAAYMSPEQVRGGELDRRTDVFALGILLYLMTTGKHPFRGENDVATLYNVTAEAPVYPPSKLVPNYPPALEAVVTRALAKDIEERFASANELQRALDIALPDSQRLTTDTEVTTFIRRLLGERHEQRQKALKTALRLADERALGRALPPPNQLEVISHSGFTPPSNVSGLLAPPGLRNSYPTTRQFTDTGPASIGTGIGAMTTSDQKGTFDGEVYSARPSGGRRVALATLAIVVVGGGGLFAAFRSTLPTSMQPEPATSTITPPPSAMTQAPSAPRDGTTLDELVAALPDVDKPPDAGPSWVPPKGWVRPQHWGAVPKPTAQPLPLPSPSAKPPPTSTSFVPPVRNPGF
jgi:serine/threonine protein kinase